MIKIIVVDAEPITLQLFEHQCYGLYNVVVTAKLTSLAQMHIAIAREQPHVVFIDESITYTMDCLQQQYPMLHFVHIAANETCTTMPCVLKPIYKSQLVAVLQQLQFHVITNQTPLTLLTLSTGQLFAKDGLIPLQNKRMLAVIHYLSHTKRAVTWQELFDTIYIYTYDDDDDDVVFNNANDVRLHVQNITNTLHEIGLHNALLITKHTCQLQLAIKTDASIVWHLVQKKNTLTTDTISFLINTYRCGYFGSFSYHWVAKEHALLADAVSEHFLHYMASLSPDLTLIKHIIHLAQRNNWYDETWFTAFTHALGKQPSNALFVQFFEELCTHWLRYFGNLPTRIQQLYGNYLFPPYKLGTN